MTRNTLVKSCDRFIYFPGFLWITKNRSASIFLCDLINFGIQQSEEIDKSGYFLCQIKDLEKNGYGIHEQQRILQRLKILGFVRTRLLKSETLRDEFGTPVRRWIKIEKDEIIKKLTEEDKLVPKMLEVLKKCP
jgi:hypothetical protein